MNSKVFGVIMFAVGAAVGSAATWKFVKTKYEKIAQEEIDSVKEVFSRRAEVKQEEPVADPAKEIAKEAIEKPSIMEYAAKLQELKYTNYSNVDSEQEIVITKEDPSMNEGPYVISPDEFGDMDEYETVSLTYYADKVLADDWDEVIEDVDNVVGLDSLERFGEYEYDSVFVRNDDRKTDYEILLDTRKYSDIIISNSTEID